MSLCGKVYDELRLHQAVPTEDEHSPNLYFSLLAGFQVSVIVVREGLAELQRDTFAHYSHRVDGVHKCLNVCIKNVAGSGFDHLGL